jgi:hypothetical protein
MDSPIAVHWAWSWRRGIFSLSPSADERDPVSDADKAAAALSAGRRDEALRFAWSALRHGPSDELPSLAPIAAQLNEPASIAAVTVRRLRPRRSRVRDTIGNIVSNVVIYTFGVAWWLGWSLLVTLTTMSNRIAAFAVSIFTPLLIMVALLKGWIETEGADGD